MASKKVNVLVYSGNGSTVDCVRHCLYTLRRLLAPNYAVIPVTSDMILKEPWQASCAALVFPGGADQGYCRTFNGEGNRCIRQYVERGGSYIGFCAGGYYGSKKCEFEVGNKHLEVIGDRELAFFPGTARGCAFSGFVYNSEKGAKAAELQVNKSALSAGSVPNVFKSYYNGGGVFVDAPKYKDRGVEVLASYADALDVDPGEGKAAIVYCKVGQGAAILTGPHPEFAADVLKPQPDVPRYSDVIEQLRGDEAHRMDFLRACMVKLGLKTSDSQDVPPLSRLYVSSATPSDVAQVLSKISHLIKTDERGEELLDDDNDTFHIVRSSAWSMTDLSKALPTEGLTKDGQPAVTEKSDTPSGQIIDYNSIVKQLLFYESKFPDLDTTPYFDHRSFYNHLERYQALRKTRSPTFGTCLLYGETVTSTNTMLEKNTQLLRNLPHGMTATATVQVAGRGRGSNVWISPPGTLLFSTVIRHPMASLQSAPVVFIQYLAAMAIVDGIKTYSGRSYEKMPIKLKWPNDIYALDPDKYASNGGDRYENYTKIGGILVNSHYNSADFIAVCGIGLNVSNTAPTTSLNQLVSQLMPQLLSPSKTAENVIQLEPFTVEKLLACVLSSFEALYTHFLTSGFDDHLEQFYYRHWLHTDQVVTLETETNKPRARIRGITRDYGLLVAEELDPYGGDQPTGKKWELMSDSNSFDFFHGLIKRKTK